MKSAHFIYGQFCDTQEAAISSPIWTSWRNIGAVDLAIGIFFTVSRQRNENIKTETIFLAGKAKALSDNDKGQNVFQASIRVNELSED